MPQLIPFKKLFRFACITSPIFGLFTALPTLGIDRAEFSRMIFSFAFTSFTALTFWMINIGILKYLKNHPAKSFAWYTASIGSSILISYLIYQFLFSKLPAPTNLPPNFHKNNFRFLFPLLRAEAVNVFIIILIELTILKNRKQVIESENNSLKLANLEANNALLQQQLNPHFLFNSLSTLKSLIKRNSLTAEEYLDKLSEILRFSSENLTKTLVPLTEEIFLCESYLDMQKVRFGDALQFNINLPGLLQTTGNVPAYSIQLLVENAIKHNILTKQQPLLIEISGNVETNSITVGNNVQLKNVTQSSKIGLRNLSERYLYLGADKIEVVQTTSYFSVKIAVLNNEGSNN